MKQQSINNEAIRDEDNVVKLHRSERDMLPVIGEVLEIIDTFLSEGHGTEEQNITTEISPTTEIPPAERYGNGSAHSMAST